MAPAAAEKQSEVVAELAERPGEDRHGVRDGTAREAAEYHWGTQLPEVSGGQVAWALRKAGLDAQLQGPTHMALMRGRVHVVYVPLHEQVHPGALSAILKTAGVTPEEFAAYLDEPDF